MKMSRPEVEKLIRLSRAFEDITKAEASFSHEKNMYSALRFSRRARGRMMPLVLQKAVIKISEAGDVNVHTDGDKLETLARISSPTQSKIRGSGIVIDYGTKNECSLSKSKTRVRHRKKELESSSTFYHALNRADLARSRNVKELLHVLRA